MGIGFISYLINGISLSSVYAIIALGYTMVYGIAKMLNLARGDAIMMGSYIVFVMISTTGLPPMAEVLLVVAVCMLLGMTIERIAYKPLRDASPLAILITATGISYPLQSVILLIFGADTKSFTPVVTLPTMKLAGGEMTITGEIIATILPCVTIMIGLTASVDKSKAGQAMPTISEDRGVATFMGINANGTAAPTFVIGSALAAIADVLFCSVYPFPTLYTGSMLGAKAFVAVVFGRIGSIPGAFIGGTLLGVIEILSKAYISPQMSDTIAFFVLIIVLPVKPAGILGKKTNEKV